MSDTHQSTGAVNLAKKKIAVDDVIVHLGDGSSDLKSIENQLIGQVKGNCDFSSRLPLETIIEFEGKRILLTHGHKYRVKQIMTLLYERGFEQKVDIVLYGHTHIAKIERQNGIYFCNPGSVAYPNRNGKGTFGEIVVEQGVIIPSIIEI